MALSLVPWRCSRNAGSGADGHNTHTLHFAKILKGWSPEKMLPLALATDEESRKEDTFNSS